jgi:hypothetical protein
MVWYCAELRMIQKGDMYGNVIETNLDFCEILIVDGPSPDPLESEC